MKHVWIFIVVIVSVNLFQHSKVVIVYFYQKSKFVTVLPIIITIEIKLFGWLVYSGSLLRYLLRVNRCVVGTTTFSLKQTSKSKNTKEHT